MSFEVPQSKRSVKQNRFEFTVDGKQYEIPLLKFAPVAAIEHFEAERVVTGLVMMCDDEATKDAIRSFDGDQLDAFSNAYQEASGVSVGESGASASS